MEEELSNYEGQIKDGKLHGKGKITNSKLSIEGTFKEGVLDGQAIVLLTNGEKYQILIEDRKLIEKKLLESSKINNSKKKPKHPFKPGPRSNPRPKSSHFFLPGLDI